MEKNMHPIKHILFSGLQWLKQSFSLLNRKVYFGKSPAALPAGAIIFFPVQKTLFCCGLAGIVAVKAKPTESVKVPLESMQKLARQITAADASSFDPDTDKTATTYLGGQNTVNTLWEKANDLKRSRLFYDIFSTPSLLSEINGINESHKQTAEKESDWFAKQMGLLTAAQVEAISARIELLKDITWCLKTEVSENVTKIQALLASVPKPLSLDVVSIYKNINAVLNSIDRLEVRGRDSAGISLMFIMDATIFEEFKQELDKAGLQKELEHRSQPTVLRNRAVSISTKAGSVAVTLTYKVAAEIGSLGDNVSFLRKQVQTDTILSNISRTRIRFHTVTAHTRWASVGAISEPNCHPVDNDPDSNDSNPGTIHACLNGDIDNYMELRKTFEKDGLKIDSHITTDTKIIPLTVQAYVQKGNDIETAFRLAVNNFEGSHAISMHTDLAPGKLFLAQKGSGQAVFVGLSREHYMPTSEVYGFVEETQRFLKMDGEKVVEGQNGPTQGQIFVLDQSSTGGIDGITGCYYDGTSIKLSPADIKQTQITSRDIDRQSYAHYFFKEISESPALIKKTLQNRWKVTPKEGQELLSVILDETAFPATLQAAVTSNQIRRIFFVGQGTACMAAMACADVINYYLDDPDLQIMGMRASELSGFKLSEQEDRGMEDTLVVAISQSGTTTDTNRAVDMAKERGARTLAIVNRRDSDLTFKSEGVIYPGTGRDIEMSVASTKALYSQIVAGTILGLYLARLKKRRSENFISAEIKALLNLPAQMEKILAMEATIADSARKHAVTKTYWAAVGSGPNKTAADEIRIKLSELCYKTISSDCVEDKKHIDLSSEPLIIVCAAGTKRTVLSDLIKDTAIFKAHKAMPIVIADEGEEGFNPYADAVFHIPKVSQHLAPVLNIMTGHIWGYHAALTINDGSRFFYSVRQDIQKTIEENAKQGMDIYEVVLEKSFREKILQFYMDFKQRKDERRLTTALPLETATDLTLLFKYLSGRLPVPDFELDFDIKGTARNMLDVLFQRLGMAINILSRPVDAIKHQAKTVTVGTSRISEKLEGILFDAIRHNQLSTAQLTNNNVIVLRNLQAIVNEIKGAILYRIEGLNLLGELTDATTIHVVTKEGVLEEIPSRVESNTHLTGTKRIIVRQGNVYIGKGRKDGRSIIVIPVISTSSDTPNRIENLLLLNITFKDEIPIEDKVKALGGKYEHIKNIVQENSRPWDDGHIEMLPTDDLFGKSAEKIGEFIVSKLT
jgi:glucosamine--fructose-6-phosphate aminotransferase (isomerizing)